jgi:serine/threonine protein kinase/Tol biopolymer transport system component
MGHGASVAAARNEEGSRNVTQERWQEVKAILAGALERPPEKRRVYLDQACTEPALRREVQSLIDAHEQAETTFMGEQLAGTSETLKSGTKLGPYEILARVGAGGMGVVYKARDTQLGRLLALKLLPESVLVSEASRTRLLREAQNASALNHPNIATIYQVGEDAGRTYIAMELVEGQSLGALLKRDGLAFETVIRYGIEISAALAHAHERGIVHRDLKPANIVITADGHAKVLDFGLAKRLSAAELEEATRSQKSLAEAGAIVGTLQYMAPETLRGEAADARTDVWALGVVLYELTSAILREQPDPLPQRVPSGLRGVIQRCLAKEREQRYQRAAEARAALEAISSQTVELGTPVKPRSARRRMLIGWGVPLILLLGLGAFEWFHLKESTPAPASQESWVQITDFADSAVSPALSPDGRILTFIRGAQTFVGAGQVYAKLLPDGEPVQLTHDGLPKMSPQFSPDGSTIAYMAGGWNTWIVPVLGGEPRLMLPNAEGLTWIDPGHLLFSEIKTGIHMAVVTATDTRDRSRDVYVPPRERGMAHRSALSPDHKWVLVAEMDNGGWLPCRLVPFDASSTGNPVGPQGAACTYAAWSPDQKWMYLSSDKGGRFHIWRERFPDGELQQVTSGPTEEEGMAIAPDGGSLITSVGLRESTIWVRDRKGEREVSSQGYAENPRFSPDGKKLYYLVRRHGVSGQFVSGELWVANLETGRSERLLPDTLVGGYDISPDGAQVVYSAKDEKNHSHLWLASLDFRFPPRQFSSSISEDQPRWDRAGHIYFRAAEGKLNFLYRMKFDGSERSKILAIPILEFHAVSPDGRWATVLGQTSGQDAQARLFASPLDGGSPVRICALYCVSHWTADGKNFMVIMDTTEGTKTLVAPVSEATGLPALPPAGLATIAEMESVKGAKIIDGPVLLGPTPGLSATVREDVHRNLYRVPLQ